MSMTPKQKLIVRLPKTTKCIQIFESQASWLDDHPEVNFSALVRHLLGDYIEERTDFFKEGVHK